MNGEITRTQLIALLRQLVDEKRTSTLYVHTDENHLIAVGVDAGEIVSLICGPKQGERAIPLVRRMGTGTFRVEDKVTARSRFGSRLPPRRVRESLAGGIDNQVEAERFRSQAHKELGRYLV